MRINKSPLLHQFRETHPTTPHVHPHGAGMRVMEACRLWVNTVTQDEKLGGSTREGLIHHCLGGYVPVKVVRGRTHPEYLALVEGERKLEIDADAGLATVRERSRCETGPRPTKLYTASIRTDNVG